MEKRNILRKKETKIIPVNEGSSDKKDFELNDEVFEPCVKIDLPVERKEPEQVEVKEPERIEVKTKKEKYSHLSEARKKSLETRKLKKEESIRLKIQAEELQKQLQQQKDENQRLMSLKSVPKSVPTPTPNGEINYDILAERIYGKFSKVENDIRTQERTIAEQEYHKKLKEYEEKQSRPQTRTKLYTSYRKKPNRAFDALNYYN